MWILGKIEYPTLSFCYFIVIYNLLFIAISYKQYFVITELYPLRKVLDEKAGLN